MYSKVISIGVFADGGNFHNIPVILDFLYSFIECLKTSSCSFMNLDKSIPSCIISKHKPRRITTTAFIFIKYNYLFFKQIIMEETIKKVFWEIVDEQNVDHIQKLLNEIIEILCSFVPSKKDIHKKIKEELEKIDWELQLKLINWIEKFQAPVYDVKTSIWKRNCPEKLSTFLQKYYSHLEIVNKEIFEHRQKLANGESLYTSSDNFKMKTGH